MPRWAPLLLAALLLAPHGGASHGEAAPPDGPGGRGGAAPWWARSGLDADRDGLDDALGEGPPGEPLRVLLAYDHHPGPGDLARAEAAGARVDLAPRHFPLLAATAPRAALPALAALPGVVLVEREDALHRHLAESVPLVRAPEAWEETGATGKGVAIAVLDDGVFGTHPDFEGKVVARFDAAPAAPGGALPLPDAAPLPSGGRGHGTHVAGIAAGTGARSGGAYRGVAPGALLVDVKVFGADDKATSATVLRGLDWVLDHAEETGVRVVVLSLGGRFSDGTDALSRAVDEATARGLVVVVSAGNGGPGPGSVTSPGTAATAITVGAVDKTLRPAPFSARGPTPDGRLKPDLVAPGVDITSTVPPASTTALEGVLSGRGTLLYGPLSGTSMAAPHVAGAAALLLEANPALAPGEVKRALLEGARDLGEPGPDPVTGHGLLDVQAAARLASPEALAQQAVGGPAPAPPAPWPGVLLLAGGAVALLVGGGVGVGLLLARSRARPPP